MLQSNLLPMKPKISAFARATIVIAIFFGIDKVMAFARQLIINNQFGLSYELDVFNAANNIPDLLSALISGGALGVALIPVLSEYLEKKGRHETWDLFVRVLNLAFIVTAVLAVVIAILAPWLIDKVIAPGFPIEQKTLSVELMRLDLIAIIVFSISGLAMAGLQAHKQFVLPALAPTLYNVGQIFGALILAPVTSYTIGGITFPHFSMGVHGLVYGVIIGAVLHLAIQLPGLFIYGFRWRPIIGLNTPGVRQVLFLMGPRVLTMFFIQIYFVARDNLASGLPEGSITALNLGWFIMQVPETLIGSALAIALLPSVSELFTKGDKAGFTKTVNTAVRTIIALTIPSVILLGIGLRPLLERGFPAFNSAEVDLVVWVTRLYLAGLTGHALLEIASRSYYAQQDARTPLWAAGVNTLFFVVMAVLMTRWIGAGGVALAGTIAFTGEALALLWLLNRRYPGLGDSVGSLGRAALGSAAGALLLFAVMRFAPVPQLIAALAGMVLGLGVSLFFVWPEIKAFFEIDKRA